jgi:NADPH-dependent 2,4-dienoyl-CoA reductase/sulfur reductase-like enzyme/peroxiredoxin family protein/rhodanese-related sulfurtransferase/TusA-related sulfurtransferase
MAKKVIIIGGVAGGASAAARLRRLNENAQILLVERGEEISYANCGLPYYIGDVISNRDRLFLQTPDSFHSRFNVDVRVRSEVVRIDRESKKVVIHDLNTGRSYSENYDQLVLATGSTPIVPRIPGIDSGRVFVLRNIPDMDRLKQFVDRNPVNSAVVIGGGFIGLEVAENLTHLQKNLTLVEMANQVLTNLDYEMAAKVHQELRDHGVNLILGNGVVAIRETDRVLEVVLNDRQVLKADMVVMAVGVRPEVRLAAEAGLELGQTGALRVDRRLRTSDPNIYAVGDAIEVTGIIAGKTFWVPLAGPANRQGRILADILSGRPEEYQGAQATSIVKVFDLTAGSTGLTEKTLKKWGIDYLTSVTHSSSHASYYPGAKPLTIKLLFAPDDGKLYGAQIVGYEGADKRLDVLATAIRFGKTVEDLTELELAYAPPFSSAKDPVNIAGYTATNILKGDVAVITWDRFLTAEPNRFFLLDVREPVEVQMGSIEGAVNIPVDQLRDRLGELPKDREIVLYCQVGLRAYLGARILMQNGFTQVKNLSGGYKTFDLVRHDREQAAEMNQPSGSAGVNQSVVNPVANKEPEEESVKLDACGLHCPGPIFQVYQSIQKMREGQLLEVTASDPGFANDVGAWCQRTGNTLEKLERTARVIKAWIRKGTGTASAGQQRPVATQDKTIVVFSGDLDKALASFVIATGAAAMGRKVTMFFTFWGLNILRKPKKVRVAKELTERMFGMMMPRGAQKLGLSRMNMGGVGPRMIRMVMGQKNIVSLESMIGQARMMGITLIACQMSMDVMGIKKEELLDGVEIGGVATYLAAAEESNVNLFI